MKRTKQKLLQALLLFAVTLAVGFTLTMTSFHLFDYLTVNEMRLLFTIDFACLIVCGGVYLFRSEQRDAQKARRRRVSQAENAMVKPSAPVYFPPDSAA